MELITPSLDAASQEPNALEPQTPSNDFHVDNLDVHNDINFETQSEASLTATTQDENHLTIADLQQQSETQLRYPVQVVDSGTRAYPFSGLFHADESDEDHINLEVESEMKSVPETHDETQL